MCHAYYHVKVVLIDLSACLLLRPMTMMNKVGRSQKITVQKMKWIANFLSFLLSSIGVYVFYFFVAYVSLLLNE